MKTCPNTLSTTRGSRSTGSTPRAAIRAKPAWRAGKECPKDSPRIEAYGTVDELNAFVGLAAVTCGEETARALRLGKLLDILRRVQHELFNLGSQLSTLPQDLHPKQARITPAEIEQLEREIDAMNQELPPLRSFVLPGGTRLNAELHAARTICRRAERLTVALGPRGGNAARRGAVSEPVERRVVRMEPLGESRDGRAGSAVGAEPQRVGAKTLTRLSKPGIAAGIRPAAAAARDDLSSFAHVDRMRAGRFDLPQNLSVRQVDLKDGGFRKHRRHPQRAAGHLQRKRAAEVGPLAQIMSVQIETLDAGVSPIRDVECFPVIGDPMRDVELPRPGSGAAPHLDALALGCIFQNARVAVAVGDEQPPVGAEGDIRGAAQARGTAHLSPVAISPTEISCSFFPCGVNFRITELPASTVQMLPSASTRTLWGTVNMPLPQERSVLPVFVHGDHRIGFVATLQDVNHPARVDRHRRNRSDGVQRDLLQRQPGRVLCHRSRHTR